MAPMIGLTLGALLGMAASAPEGHQDLLRSADRTRWYLVPVEAPLPRGQDPVTGVCGEVRWLDEAALAPEEVSADAAGAWLYEALPTEMASCADPLAERYYNRCPGPSDPLRAEADATTLEAAMYTFGVRSVVEVMDALACGEPLHRVLPDAMRVRSEGGGRPVRPALPTARSAEAGTLARLTHDLSQETAGSRRAAIDELGRVIVHHLERAPEGGDLPLSVLRLADDHLLEARARSIAEIEAADTGASGSASEDTAHAWRSKGIALYRYFLAAWPAHDRVGDARFKLGALLAEEGRTPDELYQYHLVARDFPLDPTAAKTNTLMGDWYLARGNGQFARLAYLRALDHPITEEVMQAARGLTYLYANLQDHERARDVIRSTMERALADPPALAGLVAGGGSHPLELEVDWFVREEAALGGADAAWAWLDRLDAPVAREARRQLGFELEAIGSKAEAVAVYQRLLDSDPTHPESVALSLDLAEACWKNDERDRMVSVLQDATARLHPSSAWSARAGVDRAEIGAAVEERVRMRAIEMHEEARKRGNGPAARRLRGWARALYQAYLEQFPDAPASLDVRYANAVVEGALGNHAASWGAWMDTARRMAAVKDPRLPDAVAGAIESGAAWMYGSPGPAAGVPGTPLTEAEAAFLEACTLGESLFSDHPTGMLAAYSAGMTMLARGRHAEAREWLLRAVKLQPGSSEAENAVYRLLESHETERDWVGMRATIATLRRTEVARSFVVAPHLEEMEQGATFEEIFDNVQLHRRWSARQGAEAYRAFATKHPTSKFAPRALANAAAWSRDAGHVADAVVARKQYLRSYADLPEAADQLLGLAEDNAAMLDLPAAAAALERFAAGHPRDPRATSALADAVHHRVATGAFDRAVADLDQMLARPGDPEVVFDALDHLASALEASRNWRGAARIWSRVLVDQRFDPGGTARIVAHLRLGHLARAMGADPLLSWRRGVAEAGRAGELAPAGRGALAELLFELTDADRAAFLDFELGAGIDLDGPDVDTVLAGRLRTKLALCARLDAGYEEVARLEVARWRIAAAVRSGELAEALAETLRNAPAPARLDANQLAMYRSGLEDRTWEQRERARLAYRSAIAIADAVWEQRQEWMRSPFTDRARERLGVLEPDAWPPAHERLLPPLAWAPSPPRPGADPEAE